jgi:hypothetical protein
MKKRIEAVINWFPAECGGREDKVPEGTRYAPLIEIDGFDFPNSWSSDILIVAHIGENSSQVLVGFLVEWAPYEVLTKGRSFTLSEGSHKVASGIITGDALVDTPITP